MANMSLILRFPDQSHSFVHGCELGRILEQMQRGDEIVSNHKLPIHTANKEVIQSACDTYGYNAVFKDTQYEEWTEFTGYKTSFN